MADLLGPFDPVRKILTGGQHIQQGAVAVEFGLVQIHTDHLARAKAATADNRIFRHADHTGLGPYDQQVIGCYRVTQRAQTGAVQTSHNPPAIGRTQCCGAIPRFHDCVAIGEHIAVCGLHGGIATNAGRDHQRLGGGRIAPGKGQQFKHIVQRCRIRPTSLHQRFDIGHPRVKVWVRKPGFVAFHPVDVARNGVDLTIMGQTTEWLSQLPCGEGVGRIPLVINGKTADKPLIKQVRVKLGQMFGKEHALINKGAAGQRADIQVHLRCNGRFFYPTADNVQVPLKCLFRFARQVTNKDLLNFGAGCVGFFTNAGGVYWHLPPAVNTVPKCQNLGFDNLAALFLRHKIGLGQEYLPNGNGAIARAVTRTGNGIGKEFLRNFHMNASTIAGLAIGIDRATVPDGFQGGNTGLHHLAAAFAIKGCHKTNTTGIALICRVIQPIQRLHIGIPRF